ncbi:MAG: hypothetical protein QF733_04255 [Phycisphaerales bacterium]|jgi:hypothetical protein|nr:hypothetical protein [Phycisphaerales bacterium]
MSDLEPADDDLARYPDQATATLHAWSRGDLRHDAASTPIRYVLTPDGRPAAAVSSDMLQAVDCALAIPEEGEAQLELSVTLREFEPLGGGESNSDRWKIYHGTPPHPLWAMFDIDMARFRGAILDGEAVVRPNPLAAVEPRLCGLLNREYAPRVLTTIQSQLGISPEKPRVVGVGATGLDVRNRFDVVRLDFPAPITDPAIAERAILDWISPA